MQNMIFEILRYIEQNSSPEFGERLSQLTEDEALRLYEEVFHQEACLPEDTCPGMSRNACTIPR